MQRWMWHSRMSALCQSMPGTSMFFGTSKSMPGPTMRGTSKLHSSQCHQRKPVPTNGTVTTCTALDMRRGHEHPAWC